MRRNRKTLQASTFGWLTNPILHPLSQPLTSWGWHVTSSGQWGTKLVPRLPPWQIKRQNLSGRRPASLFCSPRPISYLEHSYDTCSYSNHFKTLHKVWILNGSTLFSQCAGGSPVRCTHAQEDSGKFPHFHKNIWCKHLGWVGDSLGTPASLPPASISCTGHNLPVSGLLGVWNIQPYLFNLLFCYIFCY